LTCDFGGHDFYGHEFYFGAHGFGFESIDFGGRGFCDVVSVPMVFV
jgi:hypothetical protein